MFMIIRLNEQKFANKNKIWYRGRGKIDLGFQNWGCIFMTTSIGYASNDSNGYVEERVLTNTPLNIFNAQNPIDFKLIEKYFPSFKEQLKKGIGMKYWEKKLELIF